ncbi:putative transmembrane protein [Candidatus Burkholderia pumila]|uniref:Transmembrane protein n=1 Tax=Candidatus Burkholderia pumila TaxID=1090375 RepID=A0ABR5HN90_9BURK|nr:putative transmembrane protein [Candidatus Burkholderia pumila]
MPRPGKLPSLVPLLAVAALAGGTYWLLQATLPSGPQAPEQSKRHTADYFAENLSVSELDTTGTTQYRLTAKTLVHYEDDENSDLTLPAMRMFQPMKPTVTAMAQRGTVNGDVSIVDLYDNARILRATGYGDPQMQADSQHFRVLVNDDVIETEKPVRLQRGPSAMTANGMNYNNVTQEMKLFGNVRGAIAVSDLNGGSSK